MTVEILFEKAFLFGDENNALHLRRMMPDAQFVQTDLLDKPYFADNKPDLIYMGAMSERNQRRAIQSLLPYKDRLQQLIDEGVHMLFTGNSVDILGEYISVLEIDNKTTNRYEALGLFPCHAELKMDKRFYCSYIGQALDMDLIGFKTQFGHTYDLPAEYAFMQNERGAGLNPGAPFEGIRKNNFYATYLTGPFLIMNPHFAKFLLRSLGMNDALPFEDVAMKAFEIRLAEFKDKNRSGIGSY